MIARIYSLMHALNTPPLNVFIPCQYGLFQAPFPTLRKLPKRTGLKQITGCYCQQRPPFCVLQGFAIGSLASFAYEKDHSVSSSWIKAKLAGNSAESLMKLRQLGPWLNVKLRTPHTPFPNGISYLVFTKLAKMIRAWGPCKPRLPIGPEASERNHQRNHSAQLAGTSRH